MTAHGFMVAILKRPTSIFYFLRVQGTFRPLQALKAEFLPKYTHIYKLNLYLTGNTSHLRYRAQPVCPVWGNNRCLLREPYGTQRYNLGSPYLTGNTSHHRYRAQPVNAVWGNIRCLLWEPYGTHRYSPYLTGNTSHLRYRAQPVYAVWGNGRCLLWEPYGTQRYNMWAIRTSQETQYITFTEPNQLMLCGETFRCLLWEQYGTHRYIVVSPYLTGDTTSLCYRAQPVNVVWGNSRCLLWDWTEHTDTLWVVRTSQETRYVSTTELNRLILCGETVAVCCETERNTQIHCVGSTYLTGNTSCLRYRAQPVNTVWGNSRCLLWEPYGTHRYSLWTERKVLVC
jgi:hypothetical protein